MTCRFKGQLLPIGLGFVAAYCVTFLVLRWDFVTCAIIAHRYGFCDGWQWLEPSYSVFIDLGLNRMQAFDAMRGTWGIITGLCVFALATGVRLIGARLATRAHPSMTTQRNGPDPD